MSHHRAMLAVFTALTVAACSSSKIVNTGESPPPQPPAPAGPPPAPDNNLALVNAYDYFAGANDRAGYYFTTPSGKWRCEIVPRTTAGCQASSGSSLAIQGEPATVVNGQGESHPPNAIVVDWAGDAHFAALDQSQFTLTPGPAKALPFNKVLAAAGFHCNVQDAGVSCVSESTGNGFTFSAAGFTLQYTDVPGNAR